MGLVLLTAVLTVFGRILGEHDLAKTGVESGWRGRLLGCIEFLLNLHMGLCPLDLHFSECLLHHPLKKMFINFFMPRRTRKKLLCVDRSIFFLCLFQDKWCVCVCGCIIMLNAWKAF